MVKKIENEYIFCRNKHRRTPNYDFVDKFDEDVSTSYVLKLISYDLDALDSNIHNLKCEIELGKVDESFI